MGLDKGAAELSAPEETAERVCWKHEDCESEEACSEQSYADWQASHDTTSCGGMQSGCSLCAHIW
jgi:hypothetical protein